MRRATLAFLALLAAAPAWPAVPRKLDPPALLHLALRQPMLAERITKLYVQVGQDVLAARTHRSLPAAIAEFEAGIEPLLASSPNAEIRENYLLMRMLWREFRALASKPPTFDGAKKLADQNEEIVWVATRAARLVQAQSGASGAERTRAAAELRLLSQRIAKLHLYRHWGVRNDGLTLELAASDVSFRKSLDTLLKSPENTPPVTAELQLAHDQFLFLMQAIGRLNAGQQVKRELEFVVKTCDNILEVMDRVVQHYEAGGG